MRLFLILASAIILMSLPARANAQNGLNIANAFTSQYRDLKGATETLIEKDRLRDVNIHRYHSLSITGAPEAAFEIERMVRADGAKALDKEARYKSGHLYYGFYTLRPINGNIKRYIIYLNGNLAGNNKTVLLYIEGKATPEQVKKMLK